MTQQKRQSVGTSRDGRKDILLLLCGLLVGILFLTSVPVAWATPPHQGGTIPPPPKGIGPKKPPSKPLPPTPGIPSIPGHFPLGPGPGSFNLGLADGGCIQINVHDLPRQLLFELTPLSPDAIPAPPVCCNKTTAAYSLKIWDPLTGQLVTDVSPDYTHTICYNDADLAAAKGDPNNFFIAYYDEKGGGWVVKAAVEANGWTEIDPTIIDEPNRHAIGDTDHASVWALLAFDPDCIPEPAPETLPETGTRSNALAGVAGLGLVLLGLGGGLAYYRARRKRRPTHPELW